MGQAVVIKNMVILGDVLLIETDRSFTGQDGHVVTRDQPGHGVPALLGERIFSLDVGADYLHVLQNQVSIRRPGGWDETSVGRVHETVEDSLLFY